MKASASDPPSDGARTPNPLATGWFWRRAGPALLLILVLESYLGTRFRIALNEQVHQCLPTYTVWLIDRFDRRLARGATMAFIPGDRMQPYFAADQLVIKRLAGIPGDRVEVTTERVTVNEVPVGEGLALATTLSRPASDFLRAQILATDEVWMMGDTRDSFDARYWGALPVALMQGRAYALF